MFLKSFYESYIYDHRKFWGFILLLVICFFVAQKLINVNPNVDKNSPYYTNSIYMSDARIYNNYLDDGEKEMYDFIMDRIKRGKRVTQMTPAEYGCSDYLDCFYKMSAATRAIWLDHPELLSFASFDYQYKRETNILTFRIEKSFKLPLMNQVGEMIINHKIHQIQKETEGMTDKEKIIYVYNWIGDNATYDRIFTSDNKNQTIYNVFVNHNAVCAGFAKTALVIFQAIGINAYSIEGNTTGPHMWNVVEVEGKYYFFDSTVAACIKKEHPQYYDGLRQAQFKDYAVSHAEYYPTIEKTELFTEDDFK